MATSGSENYSRNASQIITEAHTLGGCSPGFGQALDNAEIGKGLVHANLMVKEWAADGVLLHTHKEGTLTLVADTASYTFGTGGSFAAFKPLQIISARHVVSGIETPMRIWTRLQYEEQPNPSVSGKPTAIFYDPRGGATALGIAYTWPVDTAANTITFTAQRMIEDLDAPTNDWDFPPEWLSPIMYNLAVRLAQVYGTTPRPGVPEMADQLFMKLKGYDRARAGSVFIVPAWDDY